MTDADTDRDELRRYVTRLFADPARTEDEETPADPLSGNVAPREGTNLERGDQDGDPQAEAREYVRQLFTPTDLPEPHQPEGEPMPSEHRQLRTLTTSLEAIGAKLLAKIEAERAGIDRLAERVATLDLANRLPAAVAAALEADRDPLEDPAVLRETTRASIGTHAAGRAM